jgi:hypothetical protein
MVDPFFKQIFEKYRIIQAIGTRVVQQKMTRCNQWHRRSSGCFSGVFSPESALIQGFQSF